MSARLAIAPAPGSSASAAPAQGLLQRKCDCGTHIPGGEACSRCAGSETLLRRSAVSPGSGPLQRREAPPEKPPQETPRESAGPPGVERRRNIGAPVERTVGESAVNRTGLPDHLKQGLETLSGLDLSGVRVHHDSPRPKEIGAHAFTFGPDIHVAAGQQRHLPHEGWHAVQQMQSRVLPTSQLAGLALNEDSGLEREADIMGARAAGLGLRSTGRRFATMLESATGESEEEPYPALRRPDPPVPIMESRSSEPVAQAKFVLQRAVSFADGPVTSANNLASQILAGKSDMGSTSPVVNGSENSLRVPEVVGTADADGTATLRIKSVPTNTGSYTMKLPSAGPWSTEATIATVSAAMKKYKLTLPTTCQAKDKMSFTVNGKPTNEDFVKNVTTHENLHVADIKAGFMSVVGGWDKKIEAAKAAGTTYTAPTTEAAVKQLFDAMGGMPDVIQTAMVAEWDRLAVITHKGQTSATGGKAIPSNAVMDPSCTTLSLDVT